jgi:hypothetical protein
MSLLTGSKNAVKGFGYFAGGALLASVGFRYTNVGLAAFLGVLLVCAAFSLPRTAGRRTAGLVSLFSHRAAINWLAAARLFLFGSRDAWFAVALPLFLTTSWNLESTWVGAFLAVWVIGYGIVQAAAPRIVRTEDLAAGMQRTIGATFLLLAPLALTWGALQSSAGPSGWVAAGLLLYGAVFAICSSLHSWLVVALAGADTVAERVGFYYAANAAGRLAGVLASGWLFDHFAGGTAGLQATLVASAIAVLLAGCLLLPATARDTEQQ